MTYKKASCSFPILRFVSWFVPSLWTKTRLNFKRGSSPHPAVLDIFHSNLYKIKTRIKALTDRRCVKQQRNEEGCSLSDPPHWPLLWLSPEKLCTGCSRWLQRSEEEIWTAAQRTDNITLGSKTNKTNRNKTNSVLTCSCSNAYLPKQSFESNSVPLFKSKLRHSTFLQNKKITTVSNMTTLKVNF